jgi:DNA-binding PadR family transcriptional regulator
MKKSNTKNPTLLDYAILGLLRNEDLSGYRIRKIFEETAMGNYSSSPGSIYPALKRLQLSGSVTKKEVSGKFLFHVTNPGLQQFKAWLKKPLEKRDVERRLNELLLRFAFMDNLLAKAEKRQFLSSFVTLLEEHLEDLKYYHQNEGQQLPLHGRLAFEHGIESVKTTIKWAHNALDQISKS